MPGAGRAYDFLRELVDSEASATIYPDVRTAKSRFHILELPTITEERYSQSLFELLQYAHATSHDVVRVRFYRLSGDTVDCFIVLGDGFDSKGG